MSFKSIQDLQNEIIKQLSPLMREDCVLLNTPDHVNIGDQLIWQGEIDFLEKLNIEPSYSTSLFYFDWRPFDKNTLILLHGGGNFGDVWEEHQGFRMKVIETYTDNDIVVFPQSVQYYDEAQIKKDAKRFATHKNVTICARDQHSFDLLKKHFSNKIIMVPDMAFCMDMNKWQKSSANTKKLLLKRIDREISSAFEYSKYNAFDHKDWPTFQNTPFHFSMRVYERINREVGKKLVSKDKKDTTFGVGVIRDKEYLIQKGVSFISSYSQVVSTRLHGHILSLLLEVPTIMIDNDYGKNSRFYNTWLKEMPASHLVLDDKELEAKLLALK